MNDDPPKGPRAFNFQKDTFAFANELVWEYHFDANGRWVSQPREPKSDYTHRCFVVARSARQFFEHARFDPDLPVADTETYRRLIRRVLARGPQHLVADSDRVVIPGYADLHSFSAAYEALLKSQCGPAWESYVQHGHWRILAPFSRHHQERMASQLIEDIKQNHPPVAHLIRFPHLIINHAVVLFAFKDTEATILFTAYDPNNPKTPVTLTFDRATRTFTYPANDYFPGGRVDVYEVYRDWRY